jgi:hypothetical protein
MANVEGFEIRWGGGRCTCSIPNLDNVPHGLAAYPGWPPTFAKPPPKLLLTTMSQQQQHLGPSNERQIQIALQALDQGATLSLQCAAAIYNVS